MRGKYFQRVMAGFARPSTSFFGNKKWIPGTRPGTTAERPMSSSNPSLSSNRSVLLGVACGVGAALFWATGFVLIRHGINIGFTPADLTFHRCFWGGVLLFPIAWRDGLGDLDGVGWSRGTLLAILGGPGLAFLSYSGFLLVPLGHAGIIQPSCAALFGLVLASVVLLERLPVRRAIGASTIVAGLVVIGSEAFATIGVHGVAGDLVFVVTGAFFASFATLLRFWRVAPTRATIVVSVVSLVLLPIQWLFFGFDRMIALGFQENLVQAVAQGLLAGPAAIYLFTRAVILLGAGRGSVFSSLVPPCVLLIGWITLGERPSVMQLIGLAIVLVGFRLTQRN
jgi:drug/metabolite transporter (DMT)-like permease